MATRGEIAADVRVFECPECGERLVFSVSVRRERGGLVICPCCGSVELIAVETPGRHDTEGAAAA